MLLSEIENLVKQAYAEDQDDNDTQQDLETSEELVSKLAESIEGYESAGNSKLGVAKMFMAMDILGN